MSDQEEDFLDLLNAVEAAIVQYKQRVAKRHGISEEPKKVVEADERLEPTRKAFPQDLANKLIFEETKDEIIIKPKKFLGSENFGKVASIVRNLGGEYISAGKNSHFKIPKKS